LSRTTEIEAHWVGDKVNGLAHLITGEIVTGGDIAMCGVDVEDATERQASGRPQCGLCQEGLVEYEKDWRQYR